MGIYDELKDAVNQIVVHYKEATSDGKLSFGEIFMLGGKATASFVQLFEQFTENATGEEKKAAVLAALDVFFDEVIAPIDPVVDSSLKKLSVTLAGAGIDALVAIFNKSGWGKETQPGHPQAITAPDYTIY